MAVYKNTTNQIIRAMINGSRRPINPGQTIHGPESLASIPGLELIHAQKRTILPKTSGPKPPPLPPKETKTVLQPVRSVSSFSPQISKELSYHKKMKDLGRLPSVSIAILTKDSLNLIKDCCETILSRVNYPNTTITICDTGTTDPNVRKYYEKVQSSCKDKGFGYRFIQLPDYHFSRNYNEVVKHIKTDYFLIQNNDTKAINDYVTEMMKIAIINNVGSVGPRMYYPDDRIQHDGQFIFQPSGEHRPGTAGHLNLGLRKTQIPEKQTRVSLVDGNTAAGCLVRTEDFKSVGGFDEKYGDIFQDVDLMIKIPQTTGKFNYCNRKAEIYHIDNASRFGKGPDPNRWNSMRQDTAYLKRKCDVHGWRRKTPANVDFTIVTLAYNYEDYKEMLQSFDNQKGDHTIEFIGIPNYFNMYDNIFQAYNNATDLANGKYIIYCHDDIVVTPDFLQKIKDHISELNNRRIPWGVLGPAGVFLDNHKSAFYLLDSNGQKLKDVQEYIDADKPVAEVDSLDELCLITEKAKDLRFSENNLTSFHFYGIDICTQAHIRNLKSYAIEAYCHHKSDGSKNIYDRKKFAEFVKHLKSWHIYAKQKGITHWRTTTAMCNGKSIVIFATPDYIQKELKGQPLILQA
jgi:GT2 family glycosyltransferase